MRTEGEKRARRIWQAMIGRCHRPAHSAFRHYGARGISVCERWRVFENFYADMGDPPRGLTIERKDNNLGYSLDNCIWATMQEQNRNRRSTRWLEFDGKRMIMKDWAAHIGIAPTALARRLDCGWSIQRALTTPNCTRMTRSSRSEEQRAQIRSSSLSQRVLARAFNISRATVRRIQAAAHQPSQPDKGQACLK